jgi:hemoglobin
MRARRSAFAVALALLCACQANPLAPPGRTLYHELGELDGIDALVEQFLFNLADDERINRHFADSDIERFREKLVEHFCALAGGPCTYTGDDMRRVHGGMGIGHADFNALVEDLIEAMEARGTPTATQNRLLALLAPMHADIIERP